MPIHLSHTRHFPFVRQPGQIEPYAAGGNADDLSHWSGWIDASTRDA
jgi:hypothetical protein